jgi:hypothetical protein
VVTPLGAAVADVVEVHAVDGAAESNVRDEAGHVVVQLG